MSKHLRKDIERSLNQLNKRNPMGYAQLILQPFGIIPGHVQEDNRHPWWSSPEAKQFLQQIREAAQDGPKK